MLSIDIGTGKWTKNWLVMIRSFWPHIPYIPPVSQVVHLEQLTGISHAGVMPACRFHCQAPSRPLEGIAGLLVMFCYTDLKWKEWLLLTLLNLTTVLKRLPGQIKYAQKLYDWIGLGLTCIGGLVQFFLPLNFNGYSKFLSNQHCLLILFFSDDRYSNVDTSRFPVFTFQSPIVPWVDVQ
jgi:hypothetical protein